MWPTSIEPNNEDVIMEEMRKTEKSCMTSCLVKEQTNNMSQSFSRYFSNYMDIIHVVAWTYRFLNNCRLAQAQRLKTELTSAEIDFAEKKLLMLVQQETLNDDKKISSLYPFLDDIGLIRLKTKLTKKNDTFDFRFPIILPGKHEIVQSLILYQHKKHCHAGVPSTFEYFKRELLDYWGKKIY